MLALPRSLCETCQLTLQKTALHGEDVDCKNLQKQGWRQAIPGLHPLLEICHYALLNAVVSNKQQMLKIAQQ